MQVRSGVFDIIVNVLCLIQLVGITIYLIVAWGNLPDQIPGHFGADGAVTRYDDKGILLVLPIIAWVMFIGISVVERFPQLWNTGVRVTEENKFRVYRVIKSLISKVKFIVITMFVFITIIQSLAQSLPIWFSPVFLGVLFITIIFSFCRLLLAR